MSVPQAPGGLWIARRVPQSLRCPKCEHEAIFIGQPGPGEYQYVCQSCDSTTGFSLDQINAAESNKYRGAQKAS